MNACRILCCCAAAAVLLPTASCSRDTDYDRKRTELEHKFVTTQIETARQQLLAEIETSRKEGVFKEIEGEVFARLKRLLIDAAQKAMTQKVREELKRELRAELVPILKEELTPILVRELTPVLRDELADEMLRNCVFKCPAVAEEP